MKKRIIYLLILPIITTFLSLFLLQIIRLGLTKINGRIGCHFFDKAISCSSVAVYSGIAHIIFFIIFTASIVAITTYFNNKNKTS